MTTLIIGTGYLGTRFAASLAAVAVSTADICDPAKVAEVLDRVRPAAVVNCAGKTGRPNVDWCESHQDETYRANVVGTLVLAEQCRKRGIYLLHLGSGCIFYGDSPHPGGWREDDIANPVSFYSRTKYAADLVLSRLPGVAIVRLRMPVDDRPHPRNLITKLSAYTSVIDVENSVTVVEDLISVVEKLLACRGEGIFHVTNPGTMRHRDLLALYQELVDASHTYERIDEGALLARGLAVAPRSNCVLASERLEALGIRMRPIDVALRETVARYAGAHHGGGDLVRKGE